MFLFILIFFINSTKHVFLFLRTKTVFQNLVSKHNFFFNSFFWKHKKLFSKIIFHNSFQKQQPNRPKVFFQHENSSIVVFKSEKNGVSEVFMENLYIRWCELFQFETLAWDSSRQILSTSKYTTQMNFIYKQMQNIVYEKRKNIFLLSIFHHKHYM